MGYGEYPVTIQASYQSRQAQKELLIRVAKVEKSIVNTAGVRQWDDGSFAESCNEYRHGTFPNLYQGAVGSGLYRINPAGSEPFDAYCDMTSDGGGWTRVVRQTENQPVQNWKGGVNGASYTLSSAQIPAHTQTAFGRDE